MPRPQKTTEEFITLFNKTKLELANLVSKKDVIIEKHKNKMLKMNKEEILALKLDVPDGLELAIKATRRKVINLRAKLKRRGVTV
jgi:hypothetical protein